MEEYFSNRAQEAVRSAQETAKALGAAQIGTDHLLVGVARDRGSVAVRALGAAGLDFDRISAATQQLAPSRPGAEPGVVIEFAPDAKRAIQHAVDEAQRLKAQLVGTEHLLLGVLHETAGAGVKVLVSLGADPKVVADKCYELMGAKAAGPYGADAGSETPALDTFGRDLTKLARDGKLDPVIGREKEIERCIQILSRRTKNNPVLIGDPGVGKTAIVEGLAQAIAGRRVPEMLADKKVIQLDLAGLVAGTKFRGEFEERLKGVVDEIVKGAEVILFIDEMHTLVGAGAAEGAIDAANILKPALARGELQAVGATTLDEYRKYVEKDAALERRFQPVIVDEPSVEETVAILEGLRERYAAHHHVTISDEALAAAARLSARYIADRFLPDKAIDLIDEASAKVHLANLTIPPDLAATQAEVDKLEREKEEAIARNDFEAANQAHVKALELQAKLDEVKGEWERVKAEKEEEAVVTREDVAGVLSSWTGIPVSELTEEEQARLLRMEEELHKRIVDQEEAVRAVSEAVRSARAGLKDPNQPVGTFIFLGPTGVGKTELAKALAEYLYGDEEAIVRIDMSEYQERHTVSRLVGAPPGYVGYEEGGQLTERVRRRPYSVILLDEIEKAHPDVFNILLQVMDDGRLTDSHGKTVDFKNALLIMTSNVGADRIVKLSERAHVDKEEALYEKMKEEVFEEVKGVFRPEFINRVDDVIVFHALGREELLQIVDLLMAKVRSRLLDQGMDLEITDAAREHLAETGYDPAFGARPLRRLITRVLANPIANRILKGEFGPGDTVEADFADGELVLNKSKTKKTKVKKKKEKPPKDDDVIEGEVVGGEVFD
jgi:ATP-dependent Clp protease ATP-binding subunit ClpC